MRADSNSTRAAGSWQQAAGSFAGRYCGQTESQIAALAGVPRALLFGEVSSTMDVAHEAAAEGAPAGTLVLAEHQLSGRGRAGRVWTSQAGSGVWLTLIERPWEGVPVDLLSLRAGLALAPALDRFATAPVGIKWPNDLHVHGRKLGGILIEARWRDGRPEWVALGVGINVSAPADVEHAIGLRSGVTALDVLAAVVPPLRRAAAKRGPLSSAELESFALRDVAAGKRCSEPAPGTVRGINEQGELLVESVEGSSAYRSGSLVLEDER